MQLISNYLAMSLKIIYLVRLFCIIAIGLTLAKAEDSDGAETETPRMLFDLTNKDSQKGWRSSNDTVMGGVSQGGPVSMDGFLRFKGILSLENNGGFSSTYHDCELDLSDYNGVEIKLKGDGRTYDLRFRTPARLREDWYVSYSGKMKTVKDEWITVKVPFDELNQSFRGRQLSGFPFQKDQIQQVRILLGDKKPGPFQLDVEWIRAYRDEE